ncbi:MAG: hypothetical protein PHV06_03335, partial [bacterium]|nr:hypothetical protein [bacterium]
VEFNIKFDTEGIKWIGEFIWMKIKCGDKDNEILDFGEGIKEEFSKLHSKKIKFKSINKLPDHVDYYPNSDREFNLYFEFGYEKEGEIKWIEGAIIPFKVFVIYKKSVEISLPLDVFVEISCKSARGLNSQDEIVESEFIKGCGEFAEYQGEKFKYIYPWNWNKINYPLKQFLLDTGGKCGVWSEYLEYLNLIQGIKVPRGVVCSIYFPGKPIEGWQDNETGIWHQNLYRTRKIEFTNTDDEKNWEFPNHEFIYYYSYSKKKYIIYDPSNYVDGIHEKTYDQYENHIIQNIGYVRFYSVNGESKYSWVKKVENPIDSFTFSKFYFNNEWR